MLVNELTALAKLADEDLGVFVRMNTRVGFSILEAVEYCLRQDLRGVSASLRVSEPKSLKGANVSFEFRRTSDGAFVKNPLTHPQSPASMQWSEKFQLLQSV